MRVLVTGGSGFIGSHVVDKLVADGITPRILDLVPSPHHSPDEVETRIGNITDVEAVESALDGCDAVIHLAAVADVNHVDADPERAEQINARGTWAVLEAARRAGVQRVVYGSTVWVYSDCDQVRVDEDTPPSPPRHLYTATKLAGELYCGSYAESHGLEVVVLRFGIPYGPRARSAAVVPAFVGRALAGEQLQVAGDGKQSRQFVYVEDLAEGVVAGLRHGVAGRVYNLVGEEETTILEVAEAVRERLGGAELARVPGRNGDLGRKVVSGKRARRELGWEAQTSFLQGLDRYVRWHLKQEELAGHPRVLVLTADIGEGHDLPARELAAAIRRTTPGAQATVVDGLAAMGRFVRLVVRDGSVVTLRWLPWIFELQYFLLARWRPTRWLAGRLLYMVGARPLARLIEAERPDVIVSTYPGVTAVLGDMRHRGRLALPTVSAITDLAGLRFWAHPGIDLHLVTHPESIAEVERIAGTGGVRLAQPPTAPGFLAPRDRRAARRALGLQEDGHVVVVSGGGWGVGDVAGSVKVALDTDAHTVLCLCGRNEALRPRLERRFGSDPRVRVMAFTDRMSDVLAAADVLVHSTAGLTVLEAQIRGCQVVSYGFTAGHIRLNNRAYKRFGLARTAGSRRRLAGALAQALATPREPDRSFETLPAPAELVCSATPRVRPLPAWRLRATRLATAAAVIFVTIVGSVATDATYPLLARALGVRPMSVVATSRPEVGLLVNAPADRVVELGRALHARGARVSFEFAGAPPRGALRILRALGDDAVPLLRGAGAVHWLRTRHQLHQAASTLGLSGRFYYAVPNDGFTAAQGLLARTAGATPITGAVHVASPRPLTKVGPGALVEVRVSHGAAAWPPVLASVLASLRARDLRAVSLGRLLAGRR